MTRWGAYVEQRLGEMERGEGDYTDLRQPSAAIIASARKLAAETFRDSTPTPSVVPTAEGGIDFVWAKNGYDVEFAVTEAGAEFWARQRSTGREWDALTPEVLDAMEGTP
jgi:hypothetical protein